MPYVGTCVLACVNPEVNPHKSTVSPRCYSKCAIFMNVAMMYVFIDFVAAYEAIRIFYSYITAHGNLILLKESERKR